jgi:hypothetical protein
VIDGDRRALTKVWRDRSTPAVPAAGVRLRRLSVPGQQEFSMLVRADFSAVSTVRVWYHFTWIHALA